MKVLRYIKSFVSDRALLLLFCLSFFSWILAFKEFLFGNLRFTSDAISYYEHSKFYFDNLLNHVFPLWDPYWNYGFSNSFFLIRIGIFNPFFYIILLLRKAGITYLSAYLTFLTLYFFLGMTGFYLLVKKLLGDRRAAFAAFLMLMFSSLGVRLFDSYLHLVYVPLIWFFYFLVSFSREKEKHYFTGLTLCLMLLITTYIPFYFFTICAVFFILFILFYPRHFVAQLRSYFTFIRTHKILASFCAFSVLFYMLPGLMFFQTIHNNKVVMPHRHFNFSYTPAPPSSQLAVDIENAVKWGVLEEIIYSSVFKDLRKFDPALVYLSIFIYIMLFLGAFTKVNKRQLFIFVWGLIIFGIGAPYKLPLFHFLREHVFYFKYLRNLHFFLWFALLPIVVLFLSEQLKRFLCYCPRTKKEMAAAVVIILGIHAAFFFYLSNKQTALSSSYFVVGLSAVFFASYILGWFKNKEQLTLLVLAVLIIAQPFEVFYIFNQNRKRTFRPKKYLYESPYYLRFDFEREKGDVPGVKRGDYVRPGEGKPPGIKLYIADKWLNMLYENTNSILLRSYYARHKFMLVDNIKWVRKDGWDFYEIQELFWGLQNYAYVLRPSTMPEEETALAKLFQMRGTENKDGTIIYQGGGMLRCLEYNVNEIKVKTSFPKEKFLIYNDTYDNEWEAYVDGRKTVLFRTNVAFKGILLPPGEHIVYLKYGRWWRYAVNYILLILAHLLFFYTLWNAGIYFRKRIRCAINDGDGIGMA